MCISYQTLFDSITLLQIYFKHIYVWLHIHIDTTTSKDKWTFYRRTIRICTVYSQYHLLYADKIIDSIFAHGSLYESQMVCPLNIWNYQTAELIKIQNLQDVGVCTFLSLHHLILTTLFAIGGNRFIEQLKQTNYLHEQLNCWFFYSEPWCVNCAMCIQFWFLKFVADLSSYLNSLIRMMKLCSFYRTQMTKLWSRVYLCMLT